MTESGHLRTTREKTHNRRSDHPRNNLGPHHQQNNRATRETPGQTTRETTHTNCPGARREVLAPRRGPHTSPSHTTNHRSHRVLDQPRNVITMTERTDEQKWEAVAVYVELGLAEAHRQTGIPKTSLQRWARAAGHDLAAIGAEHVERTVAATEARTARCEAMRAELKERLLETAGTLLDRVEQEHVDFRGKDAERVVWPVAPPAACRDLIVAAAVCIDKFRLENGESTMRAEIGALADEASRLAALRDELAARRDRALPVAASA